MNSVIIAAAGSGSRMGKGINKLFLPLRGEPILSYSLKQFASMDTIQEIIVVAAVQDIPLIEGLVTGMGIQKQLRVVPGGAERQYSIANALKAVSSGVDIILVHDGARPLIGQQEIELVIGAACQFKAAGIAVPVKDTIKIADDSGFSVSTPERNKLWAIQTPQAFDASVLQQAYAAACQDGFLGTDDASLVERLGIPVKLVKGSYRNIKVTTPEDIRIAEALMTDEEEADESRYRL